MRYTERTESLGVRIGRSVRRLPVDLLLAGVLVAGVFAAFLLPVAAVVRSPPVRFLLAMPLLAFLPGYALVSALFPAAPDAADGYHADALAARTGGLGWGERLVVALGVSVALVPLGGLLLVVSGAGLALEPAVLVFGGGTLAGLAVAAFRRGRLPVDERFGFPYRRWVAAVQGGTVGADSRLEVGVNVALALALLLAVSSLTYAVAVPTDGETYTSLGLLTQSDEGDLVAADYPREFARGEERELVASIGNHEATATEYTLVVQLQRVRTDGGSVSVVEREELNRLSATVEPGRTWYKRHAISPETTGEDLRLVYLLYRGEVPDTPSTESAYRHATLWIDVSE